MLDTTDWSVLITNDLDETVETITSYISYLELTNRTKTVRVYVNTIPWLGDNTKDLIREKHLARKARDQVELRKMQKELEHEASAG